MKAAFSLCAWDTGPLTISGFGSCQNGLWTHKSDIDVTAVFEEKLRENPYDLIVECRKVLRPKSFMQDIQYIPTPLMPILKYVDYKTALHVDFNVNNSLGVINSNLIFTYT